MPKLFLIGSFLLRIHVSSVLNLSSRLSIDMYRVCSKQHLGLGDESVVNLNVQIWNPKSQGSFMPPVTPSQQATPQSAGPVAVMPCVPVHSRLAVPPPA